MNKLYIMLIIVTIVFVGCNQKNDAIANLNNELDTMNEINQSNIERINDLEQEKEDLTKEIEKLKERIKEYIKEEDQQLFDSLKADENYDQHYEEYEIQTIVGFRRYSGNEIRIFPNDEKAVIKDVSGMHDPRVKIISLVRNQKNEDWALVELLNKDGRFGTNNYGYVKAELLEEYEEEEKTFEEEFPVSIGGLTIGDRLEKAIALLGRDYIKIKEWEGNFIHYGGIDGGLTRGVLKRGIDVFSSGQDNRIYGLRVDGEGYKTEAGFGVGDLAMEAYNHYSEKFDVYIDEEVGIDMGLTDTTFDLGNGYYIELVIDTDELNDDSIITGIGIFYIGWGVG